MLFFHWKNEDSKEELQETAMKKEEQKYEVNKALIEASFRASIDNKGKILKRKSFSDSQIRHRRSKTYQSFLSGK